MIGYLSKLLVFILFSFSIIGIYYGTFTFHKENFDGYLSYIILVGISYLLYKAYNHFLGDEKITFTAYKIFNFFLLHLLILSFLYFSFIGSSLIFGFSLFFKILFFLVLPILLIFLNLSFGEKILSKISVFNNQSYIFRFISSISLGFTIFTTSLAISSFFGVYNLYSLFIIIGLIGFYSYNNLLNNFSYFFTKEIVSFENFKLGEDKGIRGLQKFSFILSTEFLFIVLTFLISVNFINIVRPMPIGWDDLGVYMNYPQQMALAGTSMIYSGMNSWQTLTGIGFMFTSNVQAFFLNNIGGILSSIFLILISSDLLKGLKRTFINLPLLVATIFMAMPMVIFQQAKDMKLDLGLFAFSIAGIYMFYYLFLKFIGFKKQEKLSDGEIISLEKSGDNVVSFEDKKEIKKGNIYTCFSYKYNNLGESDLFKEKGYYILLLITGIIIGFAFSIKITTLMTILALVGIIFYSKLGVSGLFGYFSLFVAVFTKAGLWDRLNVVYPKDDISLINNVTIYSILLSILLFSYSFYKYKIESFKKAFSLFVIFILGVILALLPWFAKNIYQAGGAISIGVLLGGKGETIKVDLEKIYSKQELEELKNKSFGRGLTESGTTTNEDFGRYFGYEKGINNYVKLPFNLTMQSNQRGEYTDITYIYLALVPVLLLFLSYTNKISVVGSLGIIGGLVSLFLLNPSSKALTNFLTSYNLPGGYLIILSLFLLPTIYFLYSLNKEKLSQLFRLNIVFTFFYTFLWSIAAFGIVWYGISMYFGFLLIILIGTYYISYYSDSEEDKNNIIRFLGSVILIVVVGIYFFFSTFPHGMNNIKKSGYSTFKAGQVSQVVGIFESHPHYVSVLSELNLGDKAGDNFKEIIDSSSSEKLKSIISSNLEDYSDISTINKILLGIKSLKVDSGNKEILTIKNEANRLKEKLFYSILYPSDEYKNTKGIYRIGTFMKYFSSENFNRFYEDSLVTNFDKYIYSKDSDITVDRMRKLGLNYFLVDLNAATIDKDPRHDLTRRYENLLETFTSDKLELIDSDSLCLKLAIDEYKINGDMNNYMDLAGVNYESYELDENGNEKTINRGIKQLTCYNKILELVQTKKIDENNYSYLLDFNNYILNNKELLSNQNELIKFMQKYVTHGWFVLFKIK